MDTPKIPYKLSILRKALNNLYEFSSQDVQIAQEIKRTLLSKITDQYDYWQDNAIGDEKNNYPFVYYNQALRPDYDTLLSWELYPVHKDEVNHLSVEEKTQLRDNSEMDEIRGKYLKNRYIYPTSVLYDHSISEVLKKHNEYSNKRFDGNTKTQKTFFRKYMPILSLLEVQHSKVTGSHSFYILTKQAFTYKTYTPKYKYLKFRFSEHIALSLAMEADSYLVAQDIQDDVIHSQDIKHIFYTFGIKFNPKMMNNINTNVDFKGLKIRDVRYNCEVFESLTQMEELMNDVYLNTLDTMTYAQKTKWTPLAEKLQYQSSLYNEKNVNGVEVDLGDVSMYRMDYDMNVQKYHDEKRIASYGWGGHKGGYVQDVYADYDYTRESLKTKHKKELYESIMRKVARVVKDAIKREMI